MPVMSFTILLCCSYVCIERNRFIKAYYIIMYFKRANVIKYRDLTNTENKVQLKDFCKFIQTILYKISQRNVNGFYSSSVSVSSLYFVSVRLRAGKYSHCVQTCLVSVKLFSQEKNTTANQTD